MNSFLQRFGQSIVGVLHGFDRLRFRGSKRQLCCISGMMSWLGAMRIRLKDYRSFTRDTTVTLCRSIEEPAEQAGIYRYLNSSKDDKERTALEIAKKHGRTEGLIAVLGCLEPCMALRVRGNRQTKKLEMHKEVGKCKHYYHYYLDPKYGLRYTRLQCWLPFTMHVGLNGRDWLAKQLAEEGIAYRKNPLSDPG